MAESPDSRSLARRHFEDAVVEILGKSIGTCLHFTSKVASLHFQSLPLFLICHWDEDVSTTLLPTQAILK
jgi:hypothetical protein